jgi:hypothetical protein
VEDERDDSAHVQVTLSAVPGSCFAADHLRPKMTVLELIG